MATNRLLFLLVFALLSVSIISCKPACPIASCQVRMVHPHGGGQEFRGQPFWKKQNPKMGEKLPKVSKETSPKTNDKSKNKN
ncbi:hypothetical protein CLV24_102294 [Pontibacter ummariensis]|uniref:Uncharacterized protein n=1 Tax=Pontibacter ummariensis TaxID=1610492 RepID=A0A239BQL1_9BACT|nr:hypothetical protein [Pontibacter ummariensis]PRY15670.1 hypothetical protein CLV24_102294 [Pontibacter ummariensis]SNS10317.1 hypothetical protein SAMN06296052_102118 [Pontibacter ummariensis]